MKKLPRHSQYTNMTREEAIKALRAFNDPDLDRLAQWIAESVAFKQVGYNVRVALADAERHVDVAMAAMQTMVKTLAR